MEDDVEKRAEKANTLVQMGKISFGRQALEGATAASGDLSTLTLEPRRRTASPRAPLPEELTERRSDPCSLDDDPFARNFRNARRRVVGRSTGTTFDTGPEEEMMNLIALLETPLKTVEPVVVDLHGDHIVARGCESGTGQRE